MEKLSTDSINKIFSDARTFTTWENKHVPDALLHEIYETMKWGPTSANGCPARIIFIKSDAAKEKLISTLSEGNVEKVKAAPVTAIIAMDEKFYEKIEKLAPSMPQFKDYFASNKALAEETAFRNSSLQGAYFMLAARALGLDCGPMSGFDKQKVDEIFLKDTSWKSNFICSIGYGKKEGLYPRAPRLDFNEACIIL